MHSYLFPLLDLLYRQVGNLSFWTVRCIEFRHGGHNHIVAAIRELGTQCHQREIPSLSIYLIYHTNGNKQALLSGNCQALSDWHVLRRATFKVSRNLI